MNRALWQLAAAGLRRRRKSTLLLFAVLMLSFAFSALSLSVTESMARTSEDARLDTYGRWQAAIANASSLDEEFLHSQPWLGELGVTKCLGLVDGDAGIGTVDDAFTALGRIRLQAGRMPQAEDEVAIEAGLLHRLGYDFTLLDQVVTLPVTVYTRNKQPLRVDIDFKLVGVIHGYTQVWTVNHRSYSNDMPLLNRALLSPEGGARLRAQAAGLTEGADPSTRLAAHKPRLTYTVRHLFFTFNAPLEEVMQAVTGHFRGVHGLMRNSMQLNTGAYGESMDNQFTSNEDGQDSATALLYTGLIFASVLLAVLCIYAVQMQKQVRQFALFRSIGITRGQLRRMMLFETLLLCVPAALLGAGAGALGTWATFSLLARFGSTPVTTVIPWALLGPLALVWLLGVLLTRLAILQIALREPLTGRVASGGKKARRYRRLRTLMAGGLSGLLCGTLVFATVESLPPWQQLGVAGASPSYLVYAETAPITQSRLDAWLSLPGLTGVRALTQLEGLLTYPGAPDSPAFQSALACIRRGDAVTGSPNRGQVDGQDALGVRIFVLPDGHWDDFLPLTGSGLDLEAFRRGEQVALSFPQEPDGSYYMDCIVHKKTVERNRMGEPTMQYYYAHRDVSDLRLTPGGRLTLQFAEEIYRPELGAIVPVPTGTDATALYLDRSIYVLWCSEAFAHTLLGSSPGLTYAEVFAGHTAETLSTGQVLKEMVQRQGFGFVDRREAFSAGVQAPLQSLILQLSSGGCIALLLLLVLNNALAMEAQRQKRDYGVLQALGMSRRQLWRRLLGKALGRGLLGAALGWLVWAGYAAARAARLYYGQLTAPLALRHTPASALQEVLWRYLGAGAGAGTALLLTLLVAALVTGASLYASRALFQGDLMKKLRGGE